MATAMVTEERGRERGSLPSCPLSSTATAQVTPSPSRKRLRFLCQDEPRVMVLGHLGETLGGSGSWSRPLSLENRR